MKRSPLACAFSSLAWLAVVVPIADLVAAEGHRPQGQPSGLLLGSPVGITAKVDPSIRVKTAGFAPGTPPNWPTNAPRPDFEHLVAQITPGTLSRAVPLLAMSLGIDVIAVDEEKLDAADFPAEPLPAGVGWYPVLKVGDHGWYAIEFSVDTAQIEANADLAPEIAAARGRAEADRSVFCYVLPMSTATLLPNERESVCVLTPAHLDLPDRRDEICALNMHMGLYWTDLGRYPDVFTQRPLPLQVAVYFTVDADLLPGNEPKVLGDAWHVPTVDARTIYSTIWNGESWTRPRVYARASDLEITVPEGGAIDGLALDTEGTPAVDDDELLFSLRGTPNDVVPPERQVMHVAVAGKDPRPVVVRRRDGGGYGSLGRQMRAGRGVGDLCSGDPWAMVGRQISVFRADPLLDDFFIARRLPPDGPHVALAPAGASTLVVPLHPAGGVHELFGSEAIVEAPRTGARGFQSPLVCLPGENTPRQAPELSLAIAGYRFVLGRTAMMRACMSWPRALVATGEATVRWGRIGDYTQDPSAPGNVRWEGEQQIAYAGAPFCFDRPLPEDGILSPGRTEPGALPSAAASGSVPPPGQRGAFVMQWTLRADGHSYVSPISALRY